MKYLVTFQGLPLELEADDVDYREGALLFLDANNAIVTALAPGTWSKLDRVSAHIVGHRRTTAEEL